MTKGDSARLDIFKGDREGRPYKDYGEWSKDCRIFVPTTCATSCQRRRQWNRNSQVAPENLFRC